MPLTNKQRASTWFASSSTILHLLQVWSRIGSPRPTNASFVGILLSATLRQKRFTFGKT
ncbi:hypothetical protein HanPI659440_Chr00c07g0717181 [Helianthus annuus]|nr:hypothetical protein HanPI659440_Chr00c07g0717181 [Helianthus annuus]